MIVRKTIEVTLTRDEIEALLQARARAQVGSEPVAGAAADAEIDWSDFSDNDCVRVSWEEKA